MNPAIIRSGAFMGRDIARIKALAGKTIANGCTEAETTAAAEAPDGACLEVTQTRLLDAIYNAATPVHVPIDAMTSHRVSTLQSASRWRGADRNHLANNGTAASHYGPACRR
jgi:hypothetical protein